VLMIVFIQVLMMVFIQVLMGFIQDCCESLRLYRLIFQIDFGIYFSRVSFVAVDHYVVSSSPPRHKPFVHASSQTLNHYILSKREMSDIMRNEFMTKHNMFRKQSVYTQIIDREYYDSLASSFLNLPSNDFAKLQNRIIMILLRPLF
jgi:hypothetical protein